jgi:nitrite reductase/ring-hydroxylating ferredoxin subunit
MANFVKVASVNDIQAGQGKAVMVGDREVALFNQGGKFFAIDNVCPHAGGPLSEGDMTETVVTCPWHGATFDLKNGEALGPPAFSGVKSFKVVVEGNDVKVEV